MDAIGGVIETPASWSGLIYQPESMGLRDVRTLVEDEVTDLLGPIVEVPSSIV